MKVGFIGLGQGGACSQAAREGYYRSSMLALDAPAALSTARGPPRPPGLKRRVCSPRSRSEESGCSGDCPGMRKGTAGSISRPISDGGGARGAVPRRARDAGCAGLRRPVARRAASSRLGSGTRPLFRQAQGVLDAIGDQAIHIGPVGAGTIAKLVHNCAGYMVLGALAEVFTMGVKAGVPPADLWAAVRQGAFGRKRSFDRLAEQFLVNKFDPPAFALELAHKDVTLATEVGRV